MAAQNGTLTLVGNSGRTYTIDVHCPDAAGTISCFSTSGAAASTSPTTFRCPESSMVMDFVLAAAPTAVGAVFQVDSGAVNGGVIRYANQLAANPNRQKLAIPINAGSLIGMTQI